MAQNWSSFPGKHERTDMSKYKWRKGRPEVPGWKHDPASWTRHGLNAYKLNVLSSMYPKAKVFRGGIIPIWDGKILLVKEKDRIVIDDVDFNKKDNAIVPGFYGFSKGAVDHHKDKSILETAIREFKEEVGIEVHPGDLWFPTIVYERPEVGEVLIFFPIIYDQAPQVNINFDELDGYLWFSLGELHSMRKQMSNPTQAILKQLSNFPQFKK